MEKDPLIFAEQKIKEVHDNLEERGRPAFQRYPMLFGGLTTLGILMALYGFERFADSIALINNNPGIVLVLGIAILIATGRLYRNISN
jgi:hypothetical protein